MKPRSLAARLRRWLAAGAFVAAGFYLLVVMAACTLQRGLLYFPDPQAHPPPADLPVQVVQLTTSDGQHLVAWWLAPKPGQPAILYFGGNGDSLIGETDRLRIIAGAGVGVLAVAYRGYSGSSGHPTEAGLHADAEAAYAWLASRYPPQMIVIDGHSLGTGVAVRLAASHPARALVLESPFTSATDVAVGMLPWLPVRLLMEDRFESDRWIGKAHMPVLILHGDRDGTIPFALGQRLFALAHPPKRFVRMPGGGHDDLPERGAYDHIWPFIGVTPEGASSKQPS